MYMASRVPFARQEQTYVGPLISLMVLPVELIVHHFLCLESLRSALSVSALLKLSISSRKGYLLNLYFKILRKSEQKYFSVVFDSVFRFLPIPNSLRLYLNLSVYRSTSSSFKKLA